MRHVLIITSFLLPISLFAQSDDCSSAVSITPNLTTCSYEAGSSSGATESIPTCSGGGDADDDVWYQFVANSTDMTITVDPTVGYDAVIQLFSGTCGSLTSIQCEDVNAANGDEVLVASGLTNGATYFVRVYHYGTGSGTNTFNICVTGLAPSNNDVPCSAYVLPTVTPSCNFQVYTNSGASDSGEGTPSGCGGSAPFDGGYLGGDVWFKVEVPPSGELDIHTLGIDFADGAMALYSGACGALTMLECDDDGDPGDGILMPHIYYTGLTPGDTMYVRFWEYDNNAFGQFGICVSTPTNDSCVTAQEICDLNGYGGITSSAYDIDVTSSMCGIGDWMSPNPGCVFGTGYTGPSPVQIDNNSWLKFTASATTADLFVQVNSCQNGNGMQMQIFESSDCINFTPVSNFLETATSQSVTATGLTVGNEYYIVVDGFAGDICSYTITATNGVQVVEAIATPTELCFGADADIEAQVTGTGTYTYTWSSDPPGTYPSTPIINVSPTVSTEYVVDITGVCGSVVSASALVIVNELPIADAGSTTHLDCNTPTAQLDGTASSSGGYTYNWTTPDGNIVSGGTTTTPTINQAGTYTIHVIDTKTGCEDSAAVTITDDFTAPVASASGATTIDCNTPTTTLGATGGGSYSWTASGGGNIVSGGSTATPTVDAGGTYTVTVTAANGCTDTDNVTVTGDFTTPTAGAGADFTIDCNTPTANLSGSGGGTYSWVASGGGNIVSGASTASPSIDAGGTYTVTVTLPNGCTDTDAVTVTADFTTPTAGAGADFTIDCNTPTANLSGTGGGSYAWTTSGGGNIVSGGSTATPTVDAGGTYTVTVTLSNGCTDTDDVTVTGDFTTPTADAGADFTIDCNTPTANLSGTGGGSYSWAASAGGNIVSGGSTATPTIDAGGTYTVTVTAANGCADTDVVNVTGDFTTPTADAGADFTIDCNTPTANLSGTGGGSYSWVASGGGNIVSGGSTATPSIDAGGTYTLTVTAANGCTDSDAITITGDFATPTADAGSAGVVDCSSPQINLSGSGGGTYSWSTSDGNIISGGSSASPTVDASGTYLVTVTASNGCTDIDSTTVTVDTIAPTADAGADQLLTCDSTSVNLDGTASSGTGIGYSWSGPGVVSGGTSSIAVANVPGTYLLTVTGSNGCTDTNSVVVIPDANLPTADAGAGGLIDCNNPEAVLNGLLIADPNIVYQWTTSGGNIVTGGTSTTPTVDAAGTYYLAVSDTSNGCTAIDSVMVTADTIPPTVIISPTDSIHCNQLQIIIDASASSGSIDSYSWSTSDGNIVSGSSDDSVVVDAGGTYTLIVTGTNGCSSGATDATVFESGGPFADFMATPDSGQFPLDVSYMDMSAGASTYAWDFGNGATDSISNPNYIFTTPGTYTTTLVVTDENGCADTAFHTIIVVGDLIVEIPNIFTPNGDGDNDEFVPIITNAKSVEGVVYNRWGQLLHEWFQPKAGWNGRTSAGQYAPEGTYYFIMKIVDYQDEVHEFTGFFVLQR